MPTEQKAVEDILTGKSDLIYTVSIEVVPPIQLADFKGFTVEKPVAEVTDADVDEAIKRIADQNRAFAAKGEGAQPKRMERRCFKTPSIISWMRVRTCSASLLTRMRSLAPSGPYSVLK